MTAGFLLPPRRSPSGRAFSLIELLTVIAILGLVLALAAPPVAQIMRASGLANAGDQVVSALSHARQMAISRNRVVEVRIYKYKDSSDPGPGRYHALQLFLVEPTRTGSATNALGKKLALPSTTYLAESPSLSSLIAPDAAVHITGASANHAISPCGLDYTAATFRYFPDGSTSLRPGAPLFLTVVPANTPDDASVPPANYATVVLQPDSGKPRLHRP